MSKKRITYQNWLVELGSDPSEKIPDASFLKMLFREEPVDSDFENCGSSQKIDQKQRKLKIESAVRNALDKLSENEREFIIRFYFMGESYQQIADNSNREIYKLAALHKRAFKKLRKSLEACVEEEYGVNSEEETVCPVCSSAYIVDINNLIKGRDKKRTWKPVLEILKEKYSLSISTPQILIGHEKYHIIK